MSDARISFREFFDSVDRELKQSRVKNRVVIPDTARLAQKKDVMDWINQSLSTLSSVNPLFWRRAQTVTPTVDGNKYEFPLYWKQIEYIVIDNVNYLVGPANDLNSEFYTISDNEIVSRSGLLISSEVMLVGTFRPIKLVYGSNSETDPDMDQPIDLDEAWQELLMAMVINRYAARDRENYPQFYALKEQLLDRFQRAYPQVVTTMEQGNQIAFGQMGNTRNAY